MQQVRSILESVFSRNDDSVSSNLKEPTQETGPNGKEFNRQLDELDRSLTDLYLNQDAEAWAVVESGSDVERPSLRGQGLAIMKAVRSGSDTIQAIEGNLISRIRFSDVLMDDRFVVVGNKVIFKVVGNDYYASYTVGVSDLGSKNIEEKYRVKKDGVETELSITNLDNSERLVQHNRHEEASHVWRNYTIGEAGARDFKATSNYLDAHYKPTEDYGVYGIEMLMCPDTYYNPNPRLAQRRVLSGFHNGVTNSELPYKLEGVDQGYLFMRDEEGESFIPSHIEIGSYMPSQVNELLAA